MLTPPGSRQERKGARAFTRSGWALGALVFVVIGVGFAAQNASLETSAEQDATPTATSTTQPTATLTPTATLPPPAATETPVTVRVDCDEVNATGFASWDEQEWFYANCVELAVAPTPIPQVLAAPAAAAEVVIPDPTATSQPRPRVVMPIGAIEELVCSYGWDCGWALSVMYCESGGNPNAYNPAGPYIGLFQLHESLGSNLFDPATNVAAAYSLYLSHGPSAWGGCA